MEVQSIGGLLVAILGGAAIGLERQWSGHASGARARFGGIRTFTLLGGLAGLAGWLSALDLVALAAVLLGAAAALIVVGYRSASRYDVDATTEVAALVVLAAGTMAGNGHTSVASAVIALTALLLIEKTRLHTAVSRIDDASLRASVRFAAMALVILPLLPSGPYGPFGAIRPRELWSLVLFLSGLGFVGWLVRRLIGPSRGAIVSGMLGGLISSTSMTLQFARESRTGRSSGLTLAAGAVSASCVMLLRVLIVCTALNPALASRLPRFLTLAFVGGTVVVIGLWRQARVASEAMEMPNGSPLQLVPALQMAALFQLVLLVIMGVQAYWRGAALVATSVFVGLTDLDALTLSLARSPATANDLAGATAALLAGIVSNTLLKASVALLVGQGVFRFVTALALVVMAALVVLVALLA